MRRHPVILIIDDSKIFRLFAKEIIKRSVKWVRVFEAQDGYEGLQLYLKYKPDLVLLDYKMPRLSGEQVLAGIKKARFETRVVVTSAWNNDQHTINTLIKLGAFSFIPKPMNRTILMKSITDALYQGKIANDPNRKIKSKEALDRMGKSVVLNQHYS